MRGNRRKIYFFIIRFFRVIWLIVWTVASRLISALSTRLRRCIHWKFTYIVNVPFFCADTDIWQTSSTNIKTVNHSEFVPENLDLRKALIIGYRLRKSSGETHRMLMELDGDRVLLEAMCRKWEKKNVEGHQQILEMSNICWREYLSNIFNIHQISAPRTIFIVLKMANVGDLRKTLIFFLYIWRKVLKGLIKCLRRYMAIVLYQT